ncbi:MAG: GNAT family N-acetyltransferase [Candidatus Electryonea clarkiae]|nr:GNAT family N-acetyltransferase [Candidatus Electryonea clarkiae]MDP8285605.1 GNAT family N-acetyltransferase [Candidatus Electryonea clarkiae]
MYFDVSYYTESDRSEWERFIRHSAQGTFFHFQRFLDYHPPDRFQNHHLIFRRKSHIVAVWTGALREENGQKTWVSYPGASYGGLMTSRSLGIRDAHYLIKDLIEMAKSEGIQRIRCTPPPALYHRQPSDTIEYSMLRAGFRYLQQDYTQAVHLLTLPVDEADVLARYDSKTRTAIRKSRREGVEIRHDVPIAGETLKDFYDILLNNRKRLGVTPTHSETELARLAKLAPKYLDLTLAYYDNKTIAGILNFVCNEKVLLEFYIAHRQEAQKFRPVPLLVHETVMRAQRRGFTWLDFGISTESGGKVTWGLAAFKENFPVQGFLRNTLVLDNVQEWKPSHIFLPESSRVRTDVR